MPHTLQSNILHIAAWCSITALGLGGAQLVLGLPIIVCAALAAAVIAAGGFLTARSYARHYRFARLRIGRALKTSLGTGLLIGTVATLAAGGGLLWWTQIHAVALPAQQFALAGAVALGGCILLTELGALAAAVLFTWRAHLHTVA